MVQVYYSIIVDQNNFIQCENESSCLLKKRSTLHPSSDVPKVFCVQWFAHCCRFHCRDWNWSACHCSRSGCCALSPFHEKVNMVSFCGFGFFSQNIKQSSLHLWNLESGFFLQKARICSGNTFHRT